jgi:hypothetical protein
MRAVCLAAVIAVAASVPALAEESIVAPAPTPPPAAGPTKAAAEAFCGDTVLGAKDLIARYSGDAKLKQVYKSDMYLAYADDEKNPTVMYTLTTDRNPAHPAAVCRRIVKEGDAAVIKMNIACEGKAEECQKLTNEFNVMTAQMQAQVDAKIKSGGQ